MQEPTAMTLASVDAHGRPSARVVLFKGFHGDGLDRGLTFYTNYESRKGRELADNPNVALVFWWDKLERSVRLEGRSEEHTSELQSLMRISYAVFCLKKKKHNDTSTPTIT